MNKYTYFVDGCNIEISVMATNPKDAYQKAWDILSDDQKNRAACLECVEVEPV